MPAEPTDAASPPPRAIPRAARALTREDVAADLDAARRRAQNAARQRRYRQKRRQRDPAYAAKRDADYARLRKTERGERGDTSHAPARFIALDGESTTDADGTHRYVLLCASDGVFEESIERREGLGTLEILAFLWDLSRRYPGRVFVCFGLGYDANMILHDVPHYVLKTLWKNHEAGWYVRSVGEYVNFEWIPQKNFRASLGVSKQHRIAISEVFGFFQTSFLRALKDWKIPDRNGAIKRIESGKADRGGFNWRNIKRIRRYCFDECLLLVDLMDELARVLHRADLTPRNWQGAGSIAATMLSHEQSVIDNHRRDDQSPRLMQLPILTAYYGGRFEVFQQGEFDHAYSYDIQSAYPYAARTLPSLHGKWIRRHRYTTATFALWRVKWDTPSEICPVMPFPHRRKRRISYPTKGEGYYWADEVRAAIELWGDRIKVLEGWEYKPYTDELPFAFIDRVWQLRKAAKAAGLAENKAYKLGLNSLYGKLAQGVGYRGQPPRFRSYIWAGLITSNTRATVLRLCALDPEAVIATATDGILYTRPQDLDAYVGSDLGQLEYEAVEDLFVAGSGLYRTKEKTRRRGFMQRELDYDEIIRGWKEHGSFYTYHSSARRFIGLGAALPRKDCWDVWGRWIDTPRRLSLYPNVKFMRLEPGDFPVANVRWYPPDGVVGRRMSDPYVPKRDGFEEREAGIRWINGIEQPDLSALFD